MAKVVKAKWFQASGITGALIPPAQRRGIQPTAEAAREDVFIRAGELAALPEPIQSSCGLGRKRDLPGSAALGRADLCLARQRTADDDLAPIEVDVSPAEGHELAAPQAGVGGDADQFRILRVLISAGLDLACGQRRPEGIAMLPSASDWARASICSGE